MGRGVGFRLVKGSKQKDGGGEADDIARGR